MSLQGKGMELLDTMNTYLAGLYNARTTIPAGAATETKQDAANVLLGQLKTDLEAATPAGTNLIGKVGIDQTTDGTTNHVEAGYPSKRVDVLFTGMDAYTQYDAVGALVEVPNWARANGRSATIREMRLSINNNAIAPQFEVHFYNAADATVAADNASWTEIAAEYAKRAGYITFPSACAKATGSGTIDMVRCVHDGGDVGMGLSKEICCAAGSSSIWIKLKLLTTGISFASTPGNTIVLSIVREQS